MKRAVFLDRDGVINENVFYADTGAWESPRTAADFRLAKGAPVAMRALREAGYLLFIVSNQPNQAKHKATRADHDAIHAALMRALDDEGTAVQETFYCFHHPDGVDPELSVVCACRKPSPHFLLRAIERWRIDPAASWMVGDRGTDIECGHRAGVRTILIGGGALDGEARPDFAAPDILAAATHILSPLYARQSRECAP